MKQSMFYFARNPMSSAVSRFEFSRKKHVHQRNRLNIIKIVFKLLYEGAQPLPASDDPLNQ